VKQQFLAQAGQRAQLPLGSRKGALRILPDRARRARCCLRGAATFRREPEIGSRHLIIDDRQGNRLMYAELSPSRIVCTDQPAIEK
jgi:hypothetical protein